MLQLYLLLHFVWLLRLVPECSRRRGLLVRGLESRAGRGRQCRCWVMLLVPQGDNSQRWFGSISFWYAVMWCVPIGHPGVDTLVVGVWLRQVEGWSWVCLKLGLAVGVREGVRYFGVFGFVSGTEAPPGCQVPQLYSCPDWCRHKLYLVIAG